MRAERVGKVVLAVVAVLVGVGIAGGAASGAWWYWFARDIVEKSTSRAQASLAAHHDRFMDDEERLSRLPLLAPRPGNRDAGPVIGPHVRWSVSVLSGVREQAVVAGSPVSAEGNLDEWIHSPPDAWSGLDFGWMEKLGELDRWDLGLGGMADDAGSFQDPEPNVSDLMAWGRLRIAKGVHDGAVLPALAEVEQLARLCLTTERWVVNEAGIGLLTFVHRVRDAVPEAASFRPAASREELAIMRRVAFAALAFARLETPARYDAELDRLALGKCAALHDGAWMAYFLRPELGESRAEDFRRIETLLAAHPECPLRVLRARWSRPPDPGWKKPNGTVNRLLSSIPATRRLDAEFLIAIADQGWFRRYDEPASATP